MTRSEENFEKNIKWGPEGGGSIAEVEESKEGDPLNDWRQESLPVGSWEFAEIDDPEYKEWRNIEDFSNEEDIWALSYRPQGEEARYTMSAQREEEEIPFEEQDLSKEFQKSADKVKKRYQEAVDKRYLFSDQEFKLMNKAVRFLFEKKKNKNPERPTLAGGKEMTDKQIVELYQEWKDFSNEHPVEFADLKVKIGDWKKDTVTWNKTTGGNDNRTEWRGYSSKDKNLGYVSEKDPSIYFKNPKTGEFYFTEGPAYKPLGKNNPMVAKFVELRMPRQAKA